jgi:hypothetical protein
MRTTSRLALWICLVAAALSALPSFGQQEAQKAPGIVPIQTKRRVQFAILLDTSNSMDGLIDQAKSQLWKIVNEFSKAQRDGQHPDIQVALYQYGTPSLGIETGYTRQLLPLTDDLDKVSEALFKLATNGGDEFCGTVIQKATTSLQWSNRKDAYKAIFIAGNEPFTQGNVDYRNACHEAISKGIVVNTIFCGNEQEGISTNWKDGAMLADGSYMSINQDVKVVHIDAPQDKDIAELGAKINSTYVTYGQQGAVGAANQQAQDVNAARGGRGGGVERAITKGSANYRNGTWDLVDAVNNKSVKLEDVKDADLPEEMRKLDAKGREAFIQQKTAERAEMQKKIQTLSADREKFLAKKRKEGTGPSTFDQAVIDTLRVQAGKEGLSFEKPK